MLPERAAREDQRAGERVVFGTVGGWRFKLVMGVPVHLGRWLGRLGEIVEVVGCGMC